MDIRAKASAAIEEKRQQLAKFHDVINENMVLARIAAGDAERLRVLLLIDQMLEEHDLLAETIHQNIVRGSDYTPSVMHGRARSVLVSLREAVSGGVDACKPVEYPDVSIKSQKSAKKQDEDSDIRQSYDDVPRDQELESNIIKLMQMSGTDRVGHRALWTVDEVRVGLRSIRQNIDELFLVKAMGSLAQEGVLVPYGLSDGAKFALSDKYAKPYGEVEFSINEAIQRILRSAVDDEGYYVGWTYNQLFFAVRSESAKISDEAVEKAIALLDAEGAVVTWKDKRGRYIAIDDATMTRYKKKREKIGSKTNASRLETQHPEPAPEDEKPKTWDEVKAKLRLDESFFTTDLTGRVLRKFRRQPTRLWRDYDIEGLFKNSNNKYKITKDDDGKKSQLAEALETLIVLNLVEIVKRDSRPGLHEDRWGLTELGRVETEYP
jgi:hypothetical protein